MRNVKIFIFYFLQIFCTYSVLAQLNIRYNGIRSGDEIIKQQVEFKDPGADGTNVIWNFSNAKTINDEYTLTYTLPPLIGDSVYVFGGKRYNKQDVLENELIIGVEHNTKYYYHLKNDSLVLVGHENPLIQLEYTSPILILKYPLDYGQTFASLYKSKGLYSGTLNIQSEGIQTTIADAYGKIILPSGDTIDHVLRVKSKQLILNKDSEFRSRTTSTKEGILLETYRWYPKGYRYPVFETISNIDQNDNTRIFATAFYYPPQEHLYLDKDPENLALLDELWEQLKEDITIDKANNKTVKVSRIYPNPVISDLNIVYEVEDDAMIDFEIYSINGGLIKKINSGLKYKGVHNDIINCSDLNIQSYILRVLNNNTAIANEIILKK